MTFVKVKDHEWLDILEGIHLQVVKELLKEQSWQLQIHYGKRDQYLTIGGFPTLAEALTAAEKIIGSCDDEK